MLMMPGVVRLDFRWICKVALRLLQARLYMQVAPRPHQLMLMMLVFLEHNIVSAAASMCKSHQRHTSGRVRVGLKALQNRSILTPDKSTKAPINPCVSLTACRFSKFLRAE